MAMVIDRRGSRLMRADRGLQLGRSRKSESVLTIFQSALKRHVALAHQPTTRTT